MIAGALDGRYYKAARRRSIGERLTIAARDRIYADFVRLIAPVGSTTILDVGVSDGVGEAANVLERRHPHPGRITALGLGEAPEFQAAFPQVAYRRIVANAPLPVQDGAFDVATSNAVLEHHVGSEEAQAFHIAEMTRVAARVFVSVPNRFFPVEHHTAIPFLHFANPTFALAAAALGKAEWARPENLILMSLSRLRRLVPAGRAFHADYTGLRLGPFSSNVFLMIG